MASKGPLSRSTVNRNLKQWRVDRRTLTRDPAAVL
jgi:hypothetical protein